MRTKYPIRYEVSPTTMAPGMHWLVVTLVNIGHDEMTILDIRLNSIDVYSVDVHGVGTYLASLPPGEQHSTAFQISGTSSGRVYVTLDGRRNGEAFHWESPPLLLTVGEEAAKLVGLFAFTAPYPPVGERLTVEATIRGLKRSTGLDLDFSAETPGGAFEHVAAMQIKELEAGEEARYAAEYTPDERGLYTIFAHLYDGARRIGRAEEHVYVGRQ